MTTLVVALKRFEILKPKWQECLIESQRKTPY